MAAGVQTAKTGTESKKLLRKEARQSVFKPQRVPLKKLLRKEARQPVFKPQRVLQKKLLRKEAKQLVVQAHQK